MKSDNIWQVLKYAITLYQGHLTFFTQHQYHGYYSSEMHEITKLLPLNAVTLGKTDAVTGLHAKLNTVK